MEPFTVIVKHMGKKYDVELDPSTNGETFKSQLFSLTGVEPNRQRVLVKGRQIKDDTELSTLNLQPQQTLLLMGTPAAPDGSHILRRPTEMPRFIEDMTESEAARAGGSFPAGLQNLGNTCYLNASLQTLKAMPELEEELGHYNSPTSSFDGVTSQAMSQLRRLGFGNLTAPLDMVESLRDLFQDMSDSSEAFPPLSFLTALRKVFPQFSQKVANGSAYAQQDAEEAWSNIIIHLRDKLDGRAQVQNDSDAGSSRDSTEANPRELRFIDKYLGIGFDTKIKCLDPAAAEAGEKIVESSDIFLKVDCHISKDINHLRDGIFAALTTTVEKRSEALNRNAMYNQTWRLSRLPKYLTVHFIRFYWKREAQKKAKIMRKVTFPLNFDAVEFCTDDLQKRLTPVRDKLYAIRKDEEDMTRTRKRQKLTVSRKENGERATVRRSASPSPDVVAEEPDVFKTDAEYEAQKLESIKTGKRELLKLIDPKLATDTGANKSGLYELHAVITHQGASADSGHYTSYVRQQEPTGRVYGKRPVEDQKWWWFNDDKVTAVTSDKIESLAGGGEGHSALILLYRAVDLPTAEEVE